MLTSKTLTDDSGYDQSQYAYVQWCAPCGSECKWCHESQTDLSIQKCKRVCRFLSDGEGFYMKPWSVYPGQAWLWICLSSYYSVVSPNTNMLCIKAILSPLQYKSCSIRIHAELFFKNMLVLHLFTRHAVPFSQWPGWNTEHSNHLLI